MLSATFAKKSLTNINFEIHLEKENKKVQTLDTSCMTQTVFFDTKTDSS